MSYAASLVYRMRELASDILPMEGSNIPLDICLAVAHYHSMGQTLTMKQLVYELPYSEAGIQYNLRELRKEKWVEIQPSRNDRRVRHLLPGERLLNALERYMEETAELVDTARTSPEALLPDAPPPPPRTAFSSPHRTRR